MAQDAKVQISYQSKYKTVGRNGLITMYVFGVTGSSEAVERYKQVCEEDGYPAKEGENGEPLYFTSTHHGVKAELTISGYSGKRYVENNELDMMESQLKLVSDPDVKKAMAQAIAQRQLDAILGGASKKASATQAVEEAVEEEEGEELS